MVDLGINSVLVNYKKVSYVDNSIDVMVVHELVCVMVAFGSIVISNFLLNFPLVVAFCSLYS